MSKSNLNRQFSKFYPADASPTERVRIARREIALHASSLKTMLANLSQELKRLEKLNHTGLPDGELVENYYQQAVRHSQSINREMHEVRRAVAEHREQPEEIENDEQQ